MKTGYSRNCAGSLTLVAVVFLGLISILLMANSRSLRDLKLRLDRIEQKQAAKYQQPGKVEKLPAPEKSTP